MDKFIYTCPQWKYYGGSFDKSLYHIDHIKELRHGGSNHISNLQALCPQCHSVKTNLSKHNATVENPTKRNVTEKIKKQVAASQYFRCANVPPIYYGLRQSKPYVIGSLIGTMFYKVLTSS